ncbi:hypothetical protein J2S13_000726 [Oikeobacillus pervagus]|uniref:Uncharacterized protein n=1 Tax=Oikeobacillus pervagus TaxID=1325931 RepID=A0AAJ1SX20_9BACI|nr:hypothetical protein [Oikeobacillus pervagus]MDQ0214330.1 hypothetical protein [Oikeobacillus pervagus]
MIDFLIESLNEFTIYSLYMSLVLHFIFILTYKWTQLHSYKKHEIAHMHEMNRLDVRQSIESQTDCPSFNMLEWLPKSIRRKVSSYDENDPYHSFS